MTTTQPTARRRAADYRITAADWRAGLVTVERPDGPPLRLTVAQLRTAAQQSDPDLSAVYRVLWQTAEQELAAARRAEIAACPGHQAIRSRDEGFTGPVSSDEDRRAHGNICVIEECACGAERRSNHNGGYVEQGRWA